MLTPPQPLAFTPRDLLRFLYWVFFKPLTLDRYLKSIDPAFSFRTSMFTLWRRRQQHPQLKPLIQLAFFHILLTPWPLGFGLAWFFQIDGFNVDWFGVAAGVAVSVAVSVLGGVASRVAVGVVGGVAWGVAGGVAWGVDFGMPGGIVFGVAFGLAFGVVIGLTFGLTWGVASGMVGGVAWGVVFGGMAWGATSEVVLGVIGSVMSGVAFILGYFRLPLYLLYLPLSWTLGGGAGWRFSPVVWDELIFFPLPRLDQHLLHFARKDRQEGLEKIAFVAASFRQGWAARRALLTLIVEDMQASRSLSKIASIRETLDWLPENSQAEFKRLLSSIERISGFAQAVLESNTIYNRQAQLRLALQTIQNIRRGMTLTLGNNLTFEIGPALSAWEELVSTELKAADSLENIPNVYVSGSPLAEASKVFKGRADLFQALERELASAAEQRPALLLFGARRTGKTSVIKQLPARLGPQVIPVEFDLQAAATAESAAGLLASLGAAIQKGCAARRVDIPRLPSVENEPYPAFGAWLDSVEQAIGDDFLLIALDEYESLGEMLENGRIDERIFQFLRVLVQHHPRLILLFSGAHTLEDLPPLWSNYLVNVKMLKVNALKQDEARELVVKPIPEFNLDYEPGAVERILAATACQPYLLQLTCRELVNHINEENRLTASLVDVERALATAIASGGAYFHDLFNGRDSDDNQRAVLTALARKQPQSLAQLKRATKLPEADLQKALRRLQHRDVLQTIDGAYQITVELVRHWVQEHA